MPRHISRGVKHAVGGRLQPPGSGFPPATMNSFSACKSTRTVRPRRTTGKISCWTSVYTRATLTRSADRIVWGTDWPHPNSSTPAGRAPTEVTPLLQIDDGRLLNQLAVWVPDPSIRKKILVDNPAQLYGF